MVLLDMVLMGLSGYNREGNITLHYQFFIIPFDHKTLMISSERWQTCFSASLLSYVGFESKSVQGTVNRTYVDNFSAIFTKTKFSALYFLCGLTWRQSARAYLLPMPRKVRPRGWKDKIQRNCIHI